MTTLRSLAHAWGHADDATPRQARVIALLLLGLFVAAAAVPR